MDVLQVGTFPRWWEGGSTAIAWGILTLRWIGEAGKLPESQEKPRMTESREAQGR